MTPSSAAIAEEGIADRGEWMRMGESSHIRRAPLIYKVTFVREYAHGDHSRYILAFPVVVCMLYFCSFIQASASAKFIISRDEISSAFPCFIAVCFRQLDRIHPHRCISPK